MDKLISLVEKLAGISKPIEKLIDVLAKGAGTVYEPLGIIFKASAENHADRIKRIGEARTQWKVKEETLKGLGRVGQKILHQETKKIQNLDSIAAHSMISLAKEDNISDEMPDQDWINEFFNTVENISDENAQLLWSKILVQEIKKPGSLNKRGIEILKNINRKEAQAFERSAKYILYNGANLNRGYIILGWASKIIEPVSFNDALLLESAGLLVNTNKSNSSVRFENKKEPIAFMQGKDNLVLIHPDGHEDLRFGFYNYIVSETGLQLSRILNSDLDIQYLRELSFAFGNHSYKISYGKVDRIEGDMIHEKDMNELIV